MKQKFCELKYGMATSQSFESIYQIKFAFEVKNPVFFFDKMMLRLQIMDGCLSVSDPATALNISLRVRL